ncbi:glycosyltransferase [Weissella paramesenteroides]|uniref:glycosyltransferase n=1 Tax=Weissella paramesenteroides TaxID=1249 RepID=UPI003F2991F8
MQFLRNWGKMKNSSHKETIVILTGRILGKGGTETVLSTIANNSELNEQFNFQIFITEHKSNKDLKKFIKTLRRIDKLKVEKKSHWILRNLNLIWYLVSTNADIVIGMKPRYIQIAYFVKKFFYKKYKIVSWIHFSLNHMPGLGNSLEKMKSFLPMADAHLAISNGIAKELAEIGIQKRKIYVIYNPVPKQKKVIYQKKKEDIPQFIYVGRLYDEQKNISGLLRILSTLNFKFSFDIYGTGPDEAQLKKLSLSLFKEASNIVWHGWSPNPWQLVDSADALLLTSRYEGFPMTLLESISRGLPVVSYDCPTGPRDIIVDGKNGYLVPNGESEQFRNSIMKIINRENFSDRGSIKDTLFFLYDEKYSERLILAIKSILL